MTEHTQDDAEFVISDLTVENAPITEGEEMCVACAIENTGTGPGARWLGVGVGNEATPAKKKRILLQADGATDIHFGVEQGTYRKGNDAEYEKKTWGQPSVEESGLDGEGESVTESDPVQVTKPALFDITIDGTNSPIEEGEPLEVTATIENKGGEQGKGTGVLAAKDYNNSISNVGVVAAKDYNNSISNVGTLVDTGCCSDDAWKEERFMPSGDVVNDTGLSLPPGESKTLTFEWETDLGDAGEHEILAGGIVIPDSAKEKPQRGMVAACVDAEPVDDAVVSVEHGPMRTGKFVVKLDGQQVPGWQTVTIPGISVEQGTYHGEGDDPDEVPWGRTSWDDLEMERGVKPGDTKLHDWHQAVRQGDVEEGRKEIAVVLLDENDEPQVEWTLQEAWPKDYDPPELDASADGDVATESITVAFDEMIRTEG